MEKEEGDSPDKLKELGNNAVKNGKFEEAILHYTFAIKLEPTNYILFSNRSYAFLKVQQYQLALEDALETIKLNPTWAKGHFRKAEIEFATYQFAKAIKSYQTALQLQPEDKGIAIALTKVLKEQQKDIKADFQVPWVGAGVGIVVGVLIVMADYFGTKSPTVTHPILMASLTIAIGLVGYGVAKAIRYYMKCQRDSLISTPVDLLPEETSDKSTSNGKVTHRYTKSQARQRYQKGKS